jgi:hypothetical protein
MTEASSSITDYYYNFVIRFLIGVWYQFEEKNFSPTFLENSLQMSSLRYRATSSEETTTTTNSPSVLSDEKLKSSNVNKETQPTETQNLYRKPEDVTLERQSQQDSIGIGTYTNPPKDQSSIVSLPPMPELNYEPMQIVEPDDEYKHYQYLRRTSSTVKVITIIHWVLAVVSLILGRWWLGLGILVAPVGFYGALKFYKNLILIYGCFLTLETAVEFIVLLVAKLTLIAIVVEFVVVIVKGFVIYYLYTFWKALPREGHKAFEKFLSQEDDIQDIIP